MHVRLFVMISLQTVAGSHVFSL